MIEAVEPDAMKNLAIGLIALSSLGLGASSALGQSVPSLPGVSVAPKGQTINMSVNSGSRSSLSFGSSTSFGSSSNLNSTEGAKTMSSSWLIPKSAQVESAIGQTNDKSTTAKITNLKAASSSGSVNVTNTLTNANLDSYASGEANLTGVTAVVKMELDTQSKFIVDTNTIHKPDGSAMVPGNQVSSGGASAQLNSLTNVDINQTNFTNTFSQTF